MIYHRLETSSLRLITPCVSNINGGKVCKHLLRQLILTLQNSVQISDYFYFYFKNFSFQDIFWDLTI